MEEKSFKIFLSRTIMFKCLLQFSRKEVFRSIVNIPEIFISLWFWILIINAIIPFRLGEYYKFLKKKLDPWAAQEGAHISKKECRANILNMSNNYNATLSDNTIKQIWYIYLLIWSQSWVLLFHYLKLLYALQTKFRGGI